MVHLALGRHRVGQLHRSQGTRDTGATEQPALRAGREERRSPERPRRHAHSGYRDKHRHEGTQPSQTTNVGQHDERVETKAAGNLPVHPRPGGERSTFAPIAGGMYLAELLWPTSEALYRALKGV